MQPWGPKLAVAPRLSIELKKQLTDLLRAGWSVADVFDLHCEGQFRIEGVDRGHDSKQPNGLISFDGRDDMCSKQDIKNMKRIIDKSTWLRADNDQASVREWIKLYPE